MRFDVTQILGSVIPIVLGVEAQFSKSSGKVKKERAITGAMALLRLLGVPVRSDTADLMSHAVDDVVGVLNHTGVFKNKTLAKKREKE